MANKYAIKSFYVSDEFQDTFKELDKYVKNNNVSKSYIICEAVKEYLERQLELEVETKKKLLEGRKSPFFNTYGGETMVKERFKQLKVESETHRKLKLYAQLVEKPLYELADEAINEYLKNHSFEEDKETVFQTLLKSE